MGASGVQGELMPEMATTESEEAQPESEITLDLLDAVHANETHSQRTLAAELGIALGLTNAYLKRCIRKGWIKAKQAPANRYVYYLTPKGFSEKSRLTSQYLSRSLKFYRQARNQMDGLLGAVAAAGWRRVVLIGRGDLAEITLLCAMQHSVDIVGVVDPEAADGAQFMQKPVVADLASLPPFDVAMLTELAAPQRTWERYLGAVPAGRLLAPKLLKIEPAGGESRQ